MRKKIAFLLSLVMVLTSLPLSAFAAVNYTYSTAEEHVKDGMEKPTYSLVYMKYTGTYNDAKDGADYYIVDDDENEADGKTQVVQEATIPDGGLKAGDEFLLGLKLTNLKNLKVVDETKLLHQSNVMIKLDSNYLETEDATAMSKLLALRMGGAKRGGDNRALYGSYELDSSGVTTGAIVFNFKASAADTTPLDASTGYPNSSVGDSIIVGLIKVKVKSGVTIPAAGVEDAITFAGGNTAINFGSYGSGLALSYYAEDNANYAATTNMMKVFNFDDSGVDIFPAGEVAKPTLQGAPAITGTVEYGSTLTAGVGTLAASDSSEIGTVTYSWYNGDTKLADGNTYTIGKGLVGKTITLKATAANCDGTQSANTATTVAAKALTPSGSWTVQGKTYDGATTATITGTPTVTGLSGDTVSVTGTAAFASAAANDAATVNITGIKLTGADAANYKLADSYATTATATAKIDKAVLTLSSTNKTGKVDVAVELAGAVTDSGKVGSDNTQVTYSYALKTSTTNASISGTKLTATAAGTYTVTATATTANSNYKFTTNTKDFDVVVSDKTVSSIAITGSLAKTSYTVGNKIDLSGISVKVSYDNGTNTTMTVADFVVAGGSFSVNGTAVTHNTTEVTAAMNGKAVTATMSGKTASTTQTLTVVLPTLTITVTEQGIASKVYDGTTAAEGLTKAPTFSCNRDGATVDTSAAVYTYAQANVGTNIDVYVTGLKVGTETATYTGKVATGTITAKELTLANGTAKSGKVNTDIDLTGAVVANGGVGSDDTKVTYAYNTTTTGASITGNKLTATNAGTVTVTATATTANSNYKFTTNTKTFDVTISEKAVTGVEIVGSLTKTSYTAGETLNLSGIQVKVSYDNGTDSTMSVSDFVAAGGSFTINGSAVTNGSTEVTTAMNGKKITASIGGKSAETGALTVTLPTLEVTVTTQGTAAARQYDGTTGNVTWITAPVFTANTGATVNTDNAVYTYAQANVGTGINITVTGLKVDGEAVTVDGTVGTGEISRKELTVTAKTSVKTKSSSKVTDFITVEGLVGSDTAADLFDDTTWTNGTENAKGVTLTINTTDDAPVTAEIPLAKGNYTLKLAIDTSTFEGANANYTTSANISDQALKATKTSGGGGGGAVVTTPTTYTVTFKAGTNGSFAKDATTSVKVEKDSTLASKEVPSVTAKSGYKFIGWSLDGKTVVDPTDAKVTAAVTYTALYKENLGDHAAYMNGNEKGQFMPDANITRAEAAALLARLVPSYKEDNTYTGTFGDVKGTEWFANEVFFDVENGYITGYEDGTFKPTNNITRQEFAIIVARYLGMENEGTSSFADCNGVYAEGYISQLVAKSILNGYEDGTFRPNAYITRAEATKVLNAVFDRVPNQAVIDEAISNYNVKLTDVSKRHWAYYEILEAAIEHEIGDFHK